MKRPATAEAYVELVEQALFELEELRLSAEYDMDSLGEALPFLADIEREIRAMRAAMADGSYRFGGGDLEFMKYVEKHSERVLPFQPLLRLINATHRLGLDTGED